MTSVYVPSPGVFDYIYRFQDWQVQLAETRVVTWSPYVDVLNLPPQFAPPWDNQYHEYSSGYFALPMVKGRTYHLSTSSFFNPTIDLYDQYGFRIKDAYSGSSYVSFDFVAKETANHYVYVTAQLAYAHSNPDLTVYEDVDTQFVNSPPELRVSIPDLTATANAGFLYSLPAGTFVDSDVSSYVGDTTTYKATLDDGNSLPSWLAFDPSTHTFSGTPSSVEKGTIAVRITATDSSNAAASDVFNIKVELPWTAFAGTSGNDSFRSSSGDDTMDGGAGIDTAIYSGNRTSYTITKTSTSFTVSGSADGTDTLTNIERLQFADTKLAIDLDGNAGTTAKILGAVFGPSSVSSESYSKEYVGIGLSYLDGGMSYPDLMMLALNAKLGAGFSNTAEVNLLYQNLVGVLPSAADLNYWTGTLSSSQFSQASLAVMAADLDLDTANINLVGLAQTGIEYS